jgi:uncharacterized membrane protein YcaP (DUF421 family)
VDLVGLGLRAVFAYAALRAILRSGGKRTVAQGTAFDFVLALVLGDFVDDVIFAEVSPARFAVAVVTLALVHAVLAVVQRRSEAVARWIDGTRTLLLRDGRPQDDGLRRERVSPRALEELLRLQGLGREGWDDVAEAWLEVNGELSVVRRPEARPAVRADAGAQAAERATTD